MYVFTNKLKLKHLPTRLKIQIYSLNQIRQFFSFIIIIILTQLLKMFFSILLESRVRKLAIHFYFARRFKTKS